MQIVLYQQSGETILVTGERFIIGSDSEADWIPPDETGIAGWHAAIHQAGGRVWLEAFAERTQVNGAPVPAAGAPLDDRTEIRLGECTRLVVCFERQHVSTSAAGDIAAPPRRLSASALSLASAAVLALVVLAGYVGQRPRDDSRLPPLMTTPAAVSGPTSIPPASSTTGLLPLPAASFYQDMDYMQRRIFIKRMAQSISRLIGNSHSVYEFDEDAIDRIKHHLDGYNSRRWSKGVCENPPPSDCRNPAALRAYPRCYGGKESLSSLYRRASCRAPLVIGAFRKYGVPELVGLYVVVIETEYHNLGFQNSAKAMGMFQFIPGTARGYGVPPEERGDATRMADASAHYFKDLIADFGEGQMSVPLAIAAYNRGTGNIYTDLKKVLGSVGTERSFWELMRHPDRLPKPFRETLDYVPKFFAAAIVGENPRTFGLDLQSLSSYASWPEPC